VGEEHHGDRVGDKALARAETGCALFLGLGVLLDLKKTALVFRTHDFILPFELANLLLVLAY